MSQTAEAARGLVRRRARWTPLSPHDVQCQDKKAVYAGVSCGFYRQIETPFAEVDNPFVGLPREAVAHCLAAPPRGRRKGFSPQACSGRIIEKSEVDDSEGRRVKHRHPPMFRFPRLATMRRQLPCELWKFPRKQ